MRLAAMEGSEEALRVLFDGMKGRLGIITSRYCHLESKEMSMVPEKRCLLSDIIYMSSFCHP